MSESTARGESPVSCVRRDRRSLRVHSTTPQSSPHQRRRTLRNRSALGEDRLRECDMNAVETAFIHARMNPIQPSPQDSNGDGARFATDE